MGYNKAVSPISTTEASSNAPTTNTIKDFINQQTSSNQVVIFSKSYCPYCRMTKQLFGRMKDINMVVFELDEMPNGYEIQDELYKMTGQRTVPNVWVNGRHLGGNDDTQAAARSGRLQKLLANRL